MGRMLTDDERNAMRLLARNLAYDATADAIEHDADDLLGAIVERQSALGAALVALKMADVGELLTDLDADDRRRLSKAIEWNRSYTMGGIIDDRIALAVDEDGPDSRLACESRIAADEAFLCTLDELYVEIGSKRRMRMLAEHEAAERAEAAAA